MDASSSFSYAFCAPRDDEDVENGSQMRHQEFSAGPSSTLSLAQSQQPKQKRKYQIPNPADAEVIALSPTSLMAKNRFVCEVCNKGFQREQNLQLHRRGHNLPWNLKQKVPKEQKRKLFLCPEVTCPHHDPSRALGDLTGIKKHYSRKHGEKKFKCDKCDKKYAVLSDCKAHTRSCGTRDYRCDCGTIFSRRDSFVTHRSFCNALLKQQGAVLRPSSSLIMPSGTTFPLGLSGHQPLPSPYLRLGHDTIMRPSFHPGPSMRHDTLMGPYFHSSPSMRHDSLMSPSFQSSPGRKLQFPQSLFIPSQVPNQVPLGFQLTSNQSSAPFHHGMMQMTDQIQFDSNDHGADGSDFGSVLNLGFFPGNGTNNTSAMDSQFSGFGEDFNLYSSGDLMSAAAPSLYSTSAQVVQNTSTAQMSATALVQKAGQFSSTYSTNQGAATNSPRGFLDNFQPESLNDDNIGGAFRDIITDHLYDQTNATRGTSSSMFRGGYNENVQDMFKEDQYYGDRLYDIMAPFTGAGIEFGSLEPDNVMTRDFLGIGPPHMENTNEGEVDVSLFDSQTGNSSTSSPTQDFGGPSFDDFGGPDFL